MTAQATIRYADSKDSSFVAIAFQEKAEREALIHLQKVDLEELTDSRIEELFKKSRISTSRRLIANGSVRDIFGAINSLHQGKVPGNKFGKKKLSFKLHRALEDQSFSELSSDAQRILRNWHSSTGSLVPQHCSIEPTPISSIIEQESQIIEDSGTDLSRLTAEDLNANLTSKRSIEVGCGECGEFQKMTVASFRNAISYGLKNRTLLRCRECGVSTGRLEDAVVGYCKGITKGMNLNGGQIVFKAQYTIPGSEHMPFDGAFIFPDGFVFLVEVDGGYHWKNRNAHALAAKISADHKKTSMILARGWSMLRIDERAFSGLTAQMERALDLAVQRKAPRYEVIGEECPGAARVSSALKGITTQSF